MKNKPDSGLDSSQPQATTNNVPLTEAQELEAVVAKIKEISQDPHLKSEFNAVLNLSTEPHKELALFLGYVTMTFNSAEEYVAKLILETLMLSPAKNIRDVFRGALSFKASTDLLVALVGVRFGDASETYKDIQLFRAALRSFEEKRNILLRFSLDSDISKFEEVLLAISDTQGEKELKRGMKTGNPIMLQKAWEKERDLIIAGFIRWDTFLTESNAIK